MKKRFARWNGKLERYDITIDLADIGRISKRAYATGYISRKVLKKWRKRGEKTFKKGHCQGNCQWLPASVFKETSVSGKKFWWRCRKCHCITNFVWDTELSAPMLEAYREFTRNKETYVRPDWMLRLDAQRAELKDKREAEKENK